ncbi:MAG: pre-peptidase C-terminal domain-containing protein [Gammaproteobacteria bacterium]|nr:pre-peptidase C-terminal domain-containing protein [Gammaproteobacteria bacterium]
MRKFSIASILVSTSLVSVSPVFAGTVTERETNDTPGTAQPLAPDSNMRVSPAYMGNSPAMAKDVDFFSINVEANDVVTIDIENGYGAGEPVDTCIAVITPEGRVLRYIDDNNELRVAINDDENTNADLWDSLLKNVVFPASGTYTIGVSNWGRCFQEVTNGYTMESGDMDAGDYELVVTGVSVPAGMQHVNISVKNDHRSGRSPINPKSNGKIPVAILSSESFDATSVNTGSVTFGNTGDENSLENCHSKTVDVNRDGFPDVMCHFRTRDTDFNKYSEEGVLRATLKDGTRIEGRGNLNVVSVKPSRR